MNPWEVIRREIDGAVRSLRYDLVNRRSRRAMDEQTEELPIITAGGSRSRKVILATTAGLAVAGSISGYVVFTGGLDSLFATGNAPAGLPTSRAKPVVAGSATPAPAPAPRTSIGAKIPVAHSSPIPSQPSATPTGSPPVPTPAPTCNCATPTPSASPTSSASPTPSATSTWPSAPPASAATS